MFRKLSEASLNLLHHRVVYKVTRVSDRSPELAPPTPFPRKRVFPPPPGSKWGVERSQLPEGAMRMGFFHHFFYGSRQECYLFPAISPSQVS